MFRVVIPPEVDDYLKNVSPVLKRHLRAALDELKNPCRGKPLRDELKGLHVYRVGRHWVIYEIIHDKRVVEIQTVGPRNTIYEDF